MLSYFPGGPKTDMLSYFSGGPKIDCSKAICLPISQVGPKTIKKVEGTAYDIR
jgi:hypothetical protein